MPNHADRALLRAMSRLDHLEERIIANSLIDK
jgi:hypothetical protein